jgi:hypothetical protein
MKSVVTNQGGRKKLADLSSVASCPTLKINSSGSTHPLILTQGCGDLPVVFETIPVNHCACEPHRTESKVARACQRAKAFEHAPADETAYGWTNRTNWEGV